jgi:hypothetical protein
MNEAIAMEHRRVIQTGALRCSPVASVGDVNDQVAHAKRLTGPLACASIRECHLTSLT